MALAKTKALDLLEIVIMKKDPPSQYAEVNALCVHFDSRLDASYFAKLLVLLMLRHPVSVGMVRLTLNLGASSEHYEKPFIGPRTGPIGGKYSKHN